MALSLVEASKMAFERGEVFEATVIKQFADSSGILENIGFRNIAGNAISYNREETMPGIGFRGVNEAFSEGTGIVNPQTETLYIAGGDLDVDRFLVQTLGADMRSSQEAMKIRSLSLAWTNTFINGDTALNPREFDGIKKRVTGTQLINAGNTSGGDALSLNKLDELIDTVENPTALVMNKTLKRRLTASGRNTSVGGYVTQTMDAFGRPITAYADLPIITLDEDNNRAKILPFTEANPGGGSPASASIYCISFGDMMLEGIQNGGINARDLGELQEKACYRTRVEWYSGIMVMNPRAVARLQGIKDAPVTV
jgi:hypothetical protein